MLEKYVDIKYIKYKIKFLHQSIYYFNCFGLVARMIYLHFLSHSTYIGLNFPSAFTFLFSIFFELLKINFYLLIKQLEVKHMNAPSDKSS